MPLISGILVLCMVITAVMLLIAKASGDSVDREYEDQQQIKFLEEWKKKKEKKK